MTLTVPDTGTSVWRWIDNFLAVPWRGLHLGWYIEARQIANRIYDLAPDSLTLHGHSRGAVVAIYVAVLVRMRHRHIPITVKGTGSPRAWSRGKWYAHYSLWLSMIDVEIVNARGDIVTYLPPLWREATTRIRWVGPKRLLSIKAHYPDYIDAHDRG